MVQTLEAIRGGGGSVMVGTVGTVSYLMTRELESSTSASNASSYSRNTEVKGTHVNGPLEPKKSHNQTSSSGTRASVKHRSPEVTKRGTSEDLCKIIRTPNPKQQKQKMPLEDKGNGIFINRKCIESSGKTRSHTRCNVPIFSSENTHLEKTPLREKPRKKGSNMVDIVDLNCGKPAGSLSNRLKKLGLSRMSQSFM